MIDEKKYAIYSDPVIIAIMLTCTIGSFIMMIAGVDLSYPIADPWFIFATSILGLILSCKNYQLDSKRIIVRVFFIPIHIIRWEFVNQVLLFEKSNDDERSRGQAVFLITMRGCAEFDPEKDTVSSYKKRYHGILTVIAVPRRKKSTYKAYFEHTIGHVVEYD